MSYKTSRAVMQKSSSNKNPEVILFYDGHCALCNGAVSWILRWDERQRFHFAALQSETGERFINANPEFRKIDSIILKDHERIYTHSSAVLRVVHITGGLWRLFEIFWIVPKFLRDWIYRGIAKVRYRIFGKYDACPMPPVKWRDRFLW